MPAWPSIRCAPRAPASIARLVRRPGRRVPIHIHVAEQTAEVDDCLAATGAAPDRMAGAAMPGSTRAGSWCMPRTATPRGDRRGGAQRRRRGDLPVAPKANLGDGLRRPAGLAAGRRAAWPSARTAMSPAPGRKSCAGWNTASACCCRQRNVGAAPAEGEPATAARLFGRALGAGGTAAGFSALGAERRRARRPAGAGHRRTPACWACRPSGCWTRWSSPAPASPSAT